jgi:hypothetical protein
VFPVFPPRRGLLGSRPLRRPQVCLRQEPDEGLEVDGVGVGDGRSEFPDFRFQRRRELGIVVLGRFYKSFWPNFTPKQEVKGTVILPPSVFPGVSSTQ